MKTWFNNNSIHLAIIGIFIAITFVYFPSAWQGKELFQSDVVQAQFGQKEIMDIRAKDGDAPLWTNSMFGGMPSYQLWMYQPNNIGTHLIRGYKAIFPHPIETVMLYLLGAYALFLVLGLKPWLAAVGAMAFAFSSYNFIYIEAGHITKAYAIGLMAPVLAGIIMAFKGRYLPGAVVLALALALEIRTNHVQMTYYLFLVVLVLLGVELYRAIREKKLPNFFKAIGYQAIAVIVAIAVNASLLWPTYEYSKESIRGKANLVQENTEGISYGLTRDYAYQWSQGVGESLTFLIPNAYGGGSSTRMDGESNLAKLLIGKGASTQQAIEMANSLPIYWGDKPFTSGPWYFGAVVLYLFVLGLFILRNPLKWWLVLATALVVLLSFGKNFTLLSDLFFQYFPLYNKFRAVESILSVAMLLVPMLALLAVQEIISNGTKIKDLSKKALHSLYIVGGISLLVAIFPEMLLSFKSPHDRNIVEGYTQQLNDAGFANEIMTALVKDRIALAKSDAFRSLFFVVMAFGLIWVLAKNRLKTSTAIILLGAAIVIDLWGVDKRYLNEKLFVDKQQVDRQSVQEREVDRLILRDKDLNYRVLDLTANPFSNASTSYFHKSIGGYHAAKLMRYQEVIERQFSNTLNENVLDMLNTRYVITADQGNEGGEHVQRRNTAAGHAWFVEKVTFVASDNEEMDSIGAFDPLKEAFIHEKFKPLLGENLLGQPSNAGSITLTSYRPDRLVYEYSAPHDALAVFSEVWYDKGWKAYVDDQEQPILRANYILRALELRGGKHTVEFRFEPISFYYGEIISLIASLILVMGAAIAMWLEKRKRRQNMTT